MATADGRKASGAKRNKYFTDKKTEAFIAMVGAALIILAMIAVTLR
jgi:hypothetical protein